MRSALAKALKQAGKTLYTSASGMMPGAIAKSTQSASSGHRVEDSNKRAPEPSFNGFFPEPSSVEQTSRRSSTETSIANRKGLPYYIQRAQMRRGRPLTADEQEMVINNWKIHDTLLLDWGLEYIRSDEAVPS